MIQSEFINHKPLHSLLCETQGRSVQNKLDKTVLVIMEELQAQRLEAYCACRSLFPPSQMGRIAESIYSCFENLLGLSTSSSDEAVRRINLRSRLAYLDASSLFFRSLFLQLPPQNARQNILVHSDHLQGVPLYGALLHGIAAIETDVRYHNGNLIIAHDDADLQLGISFEDLYLRPLQELIKERPHLFADTKPFSIFIDLKLPQSSTANDDSERFYQQLYALIEKYRGMLEHYDHDGMLRPGPVRLVITGDDRRVNQLVKRGLRDAYLFLDGRFEDEGVPQELMVMRSVRYPLLGNWQWLSEKHKASDMANRPLRFWSVPGDRSTTLQKKTMELWKAFKSDNICYNTDYPARLISFLESTR